MQISLHTLSFLEIQTVSGGACYPCSCHYSNDGHGNEYDTFFYNDGETADANACLSRCRGEHRGGGLYVVTAECHGNPLYTSVSVFSFAALIGITLGGVAKKYRLKQAGTT